MRKNVIRMGKALAGLTMGTLALAGCGVDSSPSMNITGFYGLSLDADECTYTDDPIGGGTFDAGLSAQGWGDYTVYMRVINSMPDNSDEEVGRVNSNYIQLTEVEVRFPRDGVWSFLPAKKVLAAGIRIESDESELFKSLQPLDEELARLMLEGAEGVESPIPEAGDCADILLTLQARGRTGSGSEIESNDIDFPMTICNERVGCPVGWTAVGCSFVQPDGFICEEPEETTTAG